MDAEKRRESKRRWAAKTWAARQAAGRCVDCGGPLTITTPEKRGRGRPRTARCDACAAKRRGGGM